MNYNKNKLLLIIDLQNDFINDNTKGLIEKCNIDERIVNKYITNETYLSFASSMIDESRRKAMMQLLELYVVPTRKL